MGTKANPAPNDCYATAADDEPIFTLRAKDPMAPTQIRAWAIARVEHGVNGPDDDKITEALACADAMEAWREANPDQAKVAPDWLGAHLLEVRRDGGWGLQHPLRCRMEYGSLLDCPVYVAVGVSPPVAPGLHIAGLDDDGYLTTTRKR